MELTYEKKNCVERFSDDVDVRRQVNIKFANFSNGREDVVDINSLRDRGKMDAKS